MLSALSPQTNWEQNVENAYELARTGNTWGQYESSKANALAIRHGEHPDDVFKPSPRARAHQGPHKTFNFYHNIREPDDPNYLTVDRHAAAIVHGRQFGVRGEGIDPHELADKRRYDATAAPYFEVARRRGMNPNVVQATTWLAHTQRSL